MEVAHLVEVLHTCCYTQAVPDALVAVDIGSSVLHNFAALELPLELVPAHVAC